MGKRGRESPNYFTWAGPQGQPPHLELAAQPRETSILSDGHEQYVSGGSLHLVRIAAGEAAEAGDHDIDRIERGWPLLEGLTWIGP